MLKVHQDAKGDEDADLLRSVTTESQMAIIFADVLSGMYARKPDDVKLYLYNVH